MLVIGRRESEAIVLQLEDGREIRIMPTRVFSSGKVRIGIEAPSTIKIRRPGWRSQKHREEAAA